MTLLRQIVQCTGRTMPPSLRVGGPSIRWPSQAGQATRATGLQIMLLISPASASSKASSDRRRSIRSRRSTPPRRSSGTWKDTHRLSPNERRSGKHRKSDRNRLTPSYRSWVCLGITLPSQLLAWRLAYSPLHKVRPWDVVSLDLHTSQAISSTSRWPNGCSTIPRPKCSR